MWYFIIFSLLFLVKPNPSEPITAPLWITQFFPISVLLKILTFVKTNDFSLIITLSPIEQLELKWISFSIIVLSSIITFGPT